MVLTRSYNNAKLQQLKLRSVSVDSYKPIKPKLFFCSSRHNYDIIKQVKEVKVTSTVLVVLRRPSSPVHTRWAAILQTAIAKILFTLLRTILVLLPTTQR